MIFASRTVLMRNIVLARPPRYTKRGVTLAVFGQWVRFPSERAFYRYVERHLRAAFPTLLEREQFNRLQRQQRDVIVAFSMFLVEQMQAQRYLYEALDSSGIPTRDAKRRGTGGWLGASQHRLEQSHWLV